MKKKYNTEEERKAARRLYEKEYREKNKEKLKQNKLKYDFENKEKNIEYRKLNIEIKKEYDKNYVKNKLSLLSISDKKIINNRNYIKNLKYYKNYNKINRKISNNKIKERKLIDPLYNLSCSIRSLIGNSLRRNNYIKTSKTSDILGCSYEEFKLHIESKFEPWMTWGNYGNPKDGIFELNKTWDIDHVIPLSSAKTEEEILKLNHYINLQPLCSYTNRYIKKDN